jgi:hypothetical protein
MKKVSLLTVFSFAIFLIHAQNFYHNLGMNYFQSAGTYGNSDLISLQYNPQYHLTKGKTSYGLSFPLSLGMMASSARSEQRGMIYEVPVNFEMGFCPGAPCIGFQKFSAFMGIGVSTQRQIIYNTINRDFINASIGVRIAPFDIPMEMRMIASKSFHSVHDVYRLGFSFALSMN